MASAKKKSASEKKAAGKENDNLCRQYEKDGTCPRGDKCKYVHHQGTPDAPNSQDRHDDGVPLEPIDAFFAEYPTFDFKRNSPFWDQFRRLMRHMSWGGKENEGKRECAREEFKTAMVEQFNHVYGTDDRSLEAWQRLCRIVGVGEPTTLKEARTLVQRTHVNLCDLAEHPNTGEEVKIFPSVHALRAYTIRTRKFFPKEDAKAGGLLKKLLREILNVSRSKEQQQRLLEHQEQQPEKKNKKKQKQKKKKKKESKQEQPGKTIKRTDSGVHLGDSSPLSGAEHDHSKFDRPLEIRTIAAPFVRRL